MDRPINFDGAARQWRANKISLGRGRFQYKCSVEGCSEPLYEYTTKHPKFHLFALKEDWARRDHPHQDQYCEDHLDAAQSSTDRR